MNTAPNNPLTQFNQQVSQTSWWQSYIQGVIKTTGSLSLSDQQRRELDAIARQNGVTLPDSVQWDKTGMVAPKTHLWRNTAIQAGAAVGAIFGLPMLAGAVSGGGSSAALGASAGGSTAAGGSSPLWGLASPAISAGSQLWATHSANKASQRAAELEAQAAQAALDFAKQQEEERKREWQQTQDRNYQIYQDEQKRLEPYRRFGRNSLFQLSQPIYR